MTMSPNYAGIPGFSPAPCAEILAVIQGRSLLRGALSASKNRKRKKRLEKRPFPSSFASDERAQGRRSHPESEDSFAGSARTAGPQRESRKRLPGIINLST
jgi:hypothetical protein